MLNSLSVPLDHFHSSKYVIPIFTAAYLQADVYSVPQGGLPERQPGQEAHPVGKLKLWFMESGGVAFRDGVDKAKVLWQQRRETQLDQDALRTFSFSSLLKHARRYSIADRTISILLRRLLCLTNHCNVGPSSCIRAACRLTKIAFQLNVACGLSF